MILALADVWIDGRIIGLLMVKLFSSHRQHERTTCCERAQVYAAIHTDGPFTLDYQGFYAW